jgi:hypothetical protein
MHETVQVPRRLLDLLAHLIVAVEVEDVGHEIEGILVVLNLGVQPSKIEAIGQVLFIDLAEVLVPPRRDELARVSLDSSLQGPDTGSGSGGGRTQSRQ